MLVGSNCLRIASNTFSSLSLLSFLLMSLTSSGLILAKHATPGSANFVPLSLGFTTMVFVRPPRLLDLGILLLPTRTFHHNLYLNPSLSPTSIIIPINFTLINFDHLSTIVWKIIIFYYCTTTIVSRTGWTSPERSAWKQSKGQWLQLRRQRRW
jgi:hypothetical protein